MEAARFCFLFLRSKFMIENELLIGYVNVHCSANKCALTGINIDNLGPRVLKKKETSGCLY